jgi:hypothetical protein
MRYFTCEEGHGIFVPGVSIAELGFRITVSHNCVYCVLCVPWLECAWWQPSKCSNQH